MFELEDYDLDDEVFLNTQMPTVADCETPITSNLKCAASNSEDNNETLTNVSNSICDSETPQFYNVGQTNKLPKEPNKHDSNPFDNNAHNVITETKSEYIKPINENQTDKNKFNFDDCFDSDDEAFFTAPDILDDPINSLKIKDFTTEFNSKLDQNQSFSSLTPERDESILNSFKVKSSVKSNVNNLLNTTVTSVKTNTPKNSSRKFPGPAGLLSENDDLHLEDPSHLESLDMSININEKEKNEEDLCTQANDSSFSSSPYQQFLSDFLLSDVNTLIEKYNVAWIKQKLLPYTASGRFYTDKIPFFVSVIKEIDCLSPDPTVILADKTGHIRGTIHRAVWNQFSSQLKLGAVVVLSKVGVSCQKIVKGFTLNITSDHLVAIYSFSADDAQEVIVTRTTDLTNEEIVSNAKRWNVFNSETLSKSPYSEIRCRMAALNNLKSDTHLLCQSSQLSDIDYQTNDLTPVQSMPINRCFKPKTPIAHNLFKNNSSNLLEEPPAKRLRNEESDLKTQENYSIHEMSMIENIFEGINEDEIFSDFCC